jgi:hypothetical protein
MLNPRGCASVGTLPITESVPLVGSTVNPVRVLEVRSDP